jgi:hypothetical protein
VYSSAVMPAALLTAAPVLYNAQVEIRQALIHHTTATGTIDLAAFAEVNWKLTRDGTPSSDWAFPEAANVSGWKG